MPGVLDQRFLPLFGAARFSGPACAAQLAVGCRHHRENWPRPGYPREYRNYETYVRDSLPPCRRIGPPERAGLPWAALQYIFIENGRLIQLRLRCVKTRCRGCYTVIQSLGHGGCSVSRMFPAWRRVRPLLPPTGFFNGAAAESLPFGIPAAGR